MAPTSNVTATFSADMNQTTVNGSTFTLKQGTTAVPAAVTYNAATRTATVDPTADLQAGLVYTATVLGGASGVKDTSGNTLANSQTWSFTTAARRPAVRHVRHAGERGDRGGADVRT